LTPRVSRERIAAMKRAIISVVVVALLAAAWAARYAYLVAGPGDAIVYRINRWTGSSCVSINGSDWRALVTKTSPPRAQ